MLDARFRRSLLATTVTTGVSLATPAFAQNPPQPPAPVTPTDTQGVTPPAAPSDKTPPAGVQSNESSAPAEPTASQEIVITGTLIRNPNLVASAPVTVLGHDEVQLRQTNTAEEILRTIPGAAPSIGAQVNNGSGGSAYVNLRGLGSNRNIVLLDGVRLVPVDLVGRVDLNNIPLALVDRVDVLTGGASSTYGADAVSGVVNFITRSDFAGMELSVSDQLTQRGDGMYKRGDLTLGANFADGRGNAVMSIGYQESDPIYQGHDRAYSQVALSSYNVNDLTGATSGTTTPSRIDITGAPTAFQVDPTGSNIVPFYQGFNFNPYNVFQTPFRRYNLFSAAHYDISGHLTAYARGMFNNTTVDTIIAPSGVFASTVTVPVSNPFLTAAQRSFLCANADSNAALAGVQRLTAAQCAAAAAATSAADPNYRTLTFQLSRRMPELGPRISDYGTTMFDLRAGLRGDITDKIGFDVYGARGISDKTQTIQNYALLSRVRQALLATNSASCLDASNSCVPLDIFGPEGSITPAMAAFISQPASVSIRTKLSQAHGAINGDTPLELWARNPVSFALGTEYRKYTATQTSDSLAQSAGELGGQGAPQPNIRGSLDVYEGFAELIAPIVSDRPFFNELQAEAGIRRSRYTIEAPGTPRFNTTTWKLAGSWAPVRDIKFRANYQHAVRAPNIGELFTPVTGGLVALSTDPCAGAISDPNLVAVCLAQGAPAGSIGSIPQPTSGQAQQTTGGNIFLKPETAKTWTVGAVLRPRFVPGLNATVDYYNIGIDHAITLPSASDVINACFANLSSSSAADPACTSIRRNPTTGSLSGNPADTPGLPRQLSNLGRIATDGIDFTLDYRRGIGTLLNAPAKVALAIGGNWTRSSKFQSGPSALNRECAGFYSISCGIQGPAGSADPRLSVNSRATLSLGRADLSVLWRYLGPMKFEPAQMAADVASATSRNAAAAAVGKALPCPDFMGADPKGCILDPAFRRISPFNYFDLSVRFNMSEHFELTFTVPNLFDKQPPIVGNTVGTATFNSGNTYPSTYDPLGRRFAAGARIKF